ncbi:MAG: hypothetical protein WA906_09305 [Pacificimonas sp.]
MNSGRPRDHGRGGSDAAPFAFQRFAAIDWSGAKGSRHKGIALAICERGGSAPRLVEPDRIWSRTEILGWLREAARGDMPTLIAADWSFAPPYVIRGSYLPGETVPETARAFWSYVDICSDDEDLGAAGFLEQVHRPHFYFGKADGTKADYMHLRRCEAAYNAMGGGKPSSVYDAIGAAQVAKASFAGMRLLHHLGDTLPIWPFDFVADPGAARSTAGSLMVEMYSRLFIQLGGDPRGRKLRDADSLNAALKTLGSDPVPISIYNDHQSDVLVSAAGLRAIADDKSVWSPTGLTTEIARTEGWTFGVR